MFATKLTKVPRLPLARCIGPAFRYNCMVRQVPCEFALVDTGADHVFISAAIAELIGIDLDSSAKGIAEGAGGNELTVWPGETEIAITSSDDRYRWRTTVGFIEVYQNEPTAAYLGHIGFLEYFLTTFDGAERVLTLTPNEDFPGLR